MEKEKKLIKIAAIFLFIKGGLSLIASRAFFNSSSDILFLGIAFLLFGGVAIAMGISCFNIIKDEETMMKHKGWILAFAITSLIESVVAAILLFIAEEGINRYYKANNQPNAPNKSKNANKNVAVKPQISPEKRKIDILAKLGVFLVVLAGIILSTSYNSIFSSDISKPIMMGILFLLFRYLYNLFNTKVVIESSSKLYYILSYVFFVLIFVSIGYFDLLGYSLSFDGYYSNIMYSIVILSIAYSLINIRNKYDYKVLGEISFSLIIVSFILVLDQFNLNYTQIYAVLLMVSMIIYIFREKLDNSILLINNIMLASVSILFIINYFTIKDLDLFKLLVGIYIIALFRQRIVNDDHFGYIFKYALPLFINLLIAATIYQASNSCDINSISSLFITPTVFNYRMITIVIMLLNSYLFLRSSDKETIQSGLYSSIVIALIETILMTNYMYSMVGVLASIIIFSYITLILKMAQKEFIRLFCFIIQFISLLLLSINGVLFYINNGINISLDTIASVFIIFVMILNKFELKIFNEYNFRRIVYFVNIIVLLIVSSIFIVNHNVAYNLIMLVVLFIYRRYANVVERERYVYNFLFLLCVYINLNVVLLEFTTPLISHLIILVSLLITAYYLNREKYTPLFILVLSYIPYVMTLNEFALLSSNMFIILTRLPLIFIVFLISRSILSMKIKGSNVLEIILLSIVFFSYIFTVNLTLGLFTFILAIIMIYIGFKNEKYNSLFIVGIGATILNIIVQLSDFWASVPLPIYLLFSGLLIIGYVTYKEINKTKAKDEPKKEVVVNEEVNTKNNIANIILLIIILVSVCINTYNNYRLEEKHKYEKFEIRLNENGIDSSTVYFDDEYNSMFILEGCHYDVEKIIHIYNEDDSIYYGSVKVIYVSRDELQRVRTSNQNDRDEYYESSGTSRSFYHSHYMMKKFTVNKVDIYVENDPINYIERNYDYYDYYGYNNRTNRDNYLSLTYNIYDVDELELKFENLGNNIVLVETDTGGEIIYNEGTYKFKANDGKVRIYVQYGPQLGDFYKEIIQN